MIENRKTIAPIPAVGAAGEQSHGSKTTNIITEKSRTDNLNTGNLKTLSMTELYDTTYPPKAAIIDGLLYAGAYLFVGAPKIGKSFFMAQLSYHVATGTSLWQYDVHPGEVLYLALEDDYARIQKRLYKMFGSEDTPNLHFATQSMTLSGGLLDQLEALAFNACAVPSSCSIAAEICFSVRSSLGTLYSMAAITLGFLTINASGFLFSNSS